MENLIYTCIQVAHNLGAVVVVGSPAAGWWLERQKLNAGRLALLALLGWMLQAATGIGFALTSYTLKGAVPDPSGIALAALVIKVASTVIGFAAAFLLMRKGPFSRSDIRSVTWLGMFVISLAALASAAVLRWYL